MDNNQPTEGIPEAVPVVPEAAKPGPRVCPLCGGKFARVGRLSTVGDTTSSRGLTYVARDDDKPPTGGIQFWPTRDLAVRALRVCLECGFVGLFADKGVLEELRGRYRGEGQE
jgi:hypothetical protein